MGQLITKFRDNNPKKMEMEFKLSLTTKIEKAHKPKKVIINGKIFKKKKRFPANHKK